MLLKFKKWALVLTIADVQLNPLPPTLYNVPYPLLFPASRKPGAGPLGTRKLELARQQEGTALRGRRPK